MSILFPPIYPTHSTDVRHDPVAKAEVHSETSYRVYHDKQIIDKIELTTYDRNGNMKTVVNTSQAIDLLI